MDAGILGAVVDVREPAVVAGEPHQRVVGDTEFTQPLAEGADRAVHGDDLGVVRPGGVVEFREGLFVFRDGTEGPVR